MKKLQVALIIGIVSTSLWAADSADLTEQLRGAIKQLAAKENYTWVETHNGAEGQAEGKVDKDGLMYVVRNNVMESAMKEGKLATKRANGWRIVRAPQNREIGGVVRSMGDPAYLADDLVGKVNRLKEREPGVYFGDLTEEGARSLVAFGSPDRRLPTSLAGASGTVQFWVKDGMLTKVEYHIAGTLDPNGQKHGVSLTKTVEIKDVGTTKVELPDGAKAVLK
jgi:hypothetical protein